MQRRVYVYVPRVPDSLVLCLLLLLLQYSRDRRFLASCSHDKLVKFWDIAFLFDNDEEEDGTDDGAGAGAAAADVDLTGTASAGAGAGAGAGAASGSLHLEDDESDGR